MLVLLVSGCGDDGPIAVEEPVDEVVASPTTAEIMVGDTVRLSAEARSASGGTVANRVFSWSTNRVDIASVDDQGLVLGRAQGTAQIRAATGGRSGTVTVTVTPVPPEPVASVEIAPHAASLPVGDTVRLTATARSAGGGPLVGRDFTWASLDGSVAGVDGGGLVSAHSAGVARITVTAEGRSDTTSVEVTGDDPPTPAITSLTPSTIQAGWGDFTMVVRGTGFGPTSRVVWAGVPLPTFYVSDDELSSTVSSSYVAVPGVVSVVVETPLPTPLVSNELRFTIFERPASTVELRTPGNTLFVGSGVQLSAVARDQFGEIIANKSITWASSDSTILDLSGDRAHGLRVGFVTLTAYAYPVSASMMFTVSATPGADIVFETYVSDRPELFSRSLEPGAAVRRLLPPGSFAQQADVTWDGSRIAFVADDGTGNLDVYTMNRDGSDLRRLTTDPSVDDQPSWSPDGTRLAFRSFRAGKSDVWVMDSDGGSLLNLTAATVFFPEEFNDAPAWSPTTDRIAFSRGFGTGRGIYLMDPDGSDVVELIPWASGSDRLDPAWSPDGSMLAYRSYDRISQMSRVLVATSTGAPVVPGLRPFFDAGPPTWVDGSWIATTSAALPGSPVHTVVMARLGANEMVVPLAAEHGLVTGVARLPR